MDAFLRREGDVWAIQLDGRTARVRNSRGMQHLAVLLARPGVEVHVLELAGAPEAVTLGDAGPLLDDSARASYRQRLSDLASDLDEADAFNDVERSARIQAEIDALVDQLTAATGLGGKDRGAVTDAERARVAVRRALKSALDRVSDAHPPLGAHLAATVRTGAFCAYMPDPASPVRWLVGDATTATTAPVPSPTPARPLVVGRERERDTLRSAWRDFGVVLVNGEPGIGKTTLVRDLEADAEVALHGRCDDHLGVSYQPIVEAIRTLITIDGAPTIAADAGIGASALARLLPELGVSTIASEPIDTERLILFDTVARVLRSAAERRPLLLAVDDLHWAQPPTLALLLHVLRELDGAPVLTVLTYRDTEIGDDLTAFLAGIARERTLSRVVLTGIDVESIVELGASTDDAKRLLEHTGGNPYFVRALLDAPLDDSLPPSVLDVMRARVQKLSSDAQRAITLIALAGDRVPVGVAASLAGSVDPLDELLDAGLIVEDGPAIALPHALARRAVTETTSGVRRAALHLEVARALEAAGAPAADLAFHFGGAAPLGDSEPAARYSIKAADEALRSYAFEEAMALAERGLANVQSDSPDEARLQLCIGYAHAASGDLSRANAAFSVARRIAVALSDWLLLADVGLARGAVGGNVHVHDAELAGELTEAIERLGDADPMRRSTLLARLAIEESGAGHFVEARRLAAEAVDVARASGEPIALHVSVRAKWIVSDAPELLDDRRELAAELDTLAAVHGGINERINAKGIVATTAAETGDIEVLDTALAELSRLTQATRMPRNEWFDLELRVLRAVMAGDLEDAEKLADRELEIGMATSVPNAWRGYALQLIVIRWEQGRAGELADIAVEMADSDDLPGTRVMAAIACVHAERTDDARALLERVDLASLPNDSVQLGTLCAAASLALELGDHSHAAEIDPLLAPFAGRNCVIALGTISIGPVDRYLSFTARVLGDNARAEQHLAAAVALDERMRARRWLERDRADLAALSGSTTRN